MLAINVQNLFKSYKLYESSTDRLKESILNKKYHKDFHALSDISFKINKGETVGILGKNGSGKSTLLKIITGVLTPTSGSVEIHGRVSALLELGAGFNLEYTGLENIYLNGTIMGYSKQEMDNKLSDILSFAEIGDFVYQPVKMYSSGMFARLAFSFAIHVNPDILIVDEALAVGDIRFQSKCFEKFKALKKQGVTILFVSHDVQSVRNFCDKAIWINSGKMIKYGDTVEITSDYIEFMNTQDFQDENRVDKIQVRELDRSILKSEFNPIKRWGKYPNLIQYVDITSNGKSTEVLNYGDEVFVSIAFQVPDGIDLNTLSVAFSIKTPQGIDLLVATTFDDKIIRIDQSNVLVEVKFSFINYLNSGDYVLIAALEDRSQSMPSYYDFIEGAKYFKVITNKQLFGMVNLPMKMGINYIEV